MLLVGQFRMVSIAVDLLESRFGSTKRIEAALPDNGVGGFAARNRDQTLPARKATAELQLGELLEIEEAARINAAGAQSRT